MCLNRNNFNKWKDSKWTSWFGGVCTGLLISALSLWITPYLTPKDPCANLATKGYERTREHFGEALKMHDIEGVEDFLNCGMTPETPPFNTLPAGCWYTAFSKENKEKENELLDLLIEKGWDVNFDCSWPPPFKFKSDWFGNLLTVAMVKERFGLVEHLINRGAKTDRIVSSLENELIFIYDFLNKANKDTDFTNEICRSRIYSADRYAAFSSWLTVQKSLGSVNTIIEGENKYCSRFKIEPNEIKFYEARLEQLETWANNLKGIGVEINNKDTLLALNKKLELINNEKKVKLKTTIENCMSHYLSMPKRSLLNEATAFNYDSADTYNEEQMVYALLKKELLFGGRRISNKKYFNQIIEESCRQYHISRN